MESKARFLTAREAARVYHVSQWTIVKAARKAAIRTRYCRKRWRLLYENGPELAEAVTRCLSAETGRCQLMHHPVNQALDAILSALRGTC